MNIVVTGATGFIGRHVISELVRRKFLPLVLGRNQNKLDELHETYKIPTVCADICSTRQGWFDLLQQPDVVIHLAWEELDDFNALSHLEKVLPCHMKFLSNLCRAGLTRLVVGGTCFEYGMQDGKLTEDMPAEPVTTYAIAKNTLRLYLEKLREQIGISVAWLRYFYMYGEGQSAKALLPQLEAAVKNGKTVFNMSGGGQLRDYLPVEDVACLTTQFAVDIESEGIFNVGSGIPVSIRNLVERRIEELGATIRLSLGYYPYPEYEPMAFWGDTSRLFEVLPGMDVYEREKTDSTG